MASAVAPPKKGKKTSDKLKEKSKLKKAKKLKLPEPAPPPPVQKKKHGLYDDYADHVVAALSSYVYFIQYVIYPSNFHAGSEDWTIGDIYNEWEELLLTETKLRVLAPRDFTKSFFFCEGYVTWRLWREDRFRTLIFSKTDGVAKERLYNIKALIERIPMLRYMMETAETWATKEIRLANGSRVVVAGYNSNIRGEHTELIILDDPIDSQVIYSDDQNRKTKERLLMEITPVAEPHTQILITGTVQRDDDLYMALPDEYVMKTYQAIVSEEKQLTLYPEKWSWEALMKRKALYLYEEGSERYFLKEYMNDPKALQGAIFAEKWFKYVHRDNLPPLSDMALYLGADLAVGKKPDEGAYTAFVLIGVHVQTNLVYILEVVRARMKLPERIGTLKRICEEYPEIMVCTIEDNGFQEDTVQAAVATLQVPVMGITSHKNKLIGAENMSVHFRNARIHFVCEGFSETDGRPILAKPQRDLRKELLSAPGATWDQIDALDKALKGARYAAPAMDPEDYAEIIAQMAAKAKKQTDPLNGDVVNLNRYYHSYKEF